MEEDACWNKKEVGIVATVASEISDEITENIPRLYMRIQNLGECTLWER